MKSLRLAVVTAAALLACACTREARLYPVNQEAISGGVLIAQFKAYGSGHGEMTVALPSGEQLKGEYSLVREGSMTFGSIYASAYGPNGSATATGSSTSYSVPGGSPGVASAFGDRGTSLQCEFYNDNFSGHGYGGCKSSAGALYRIQY